MSAPTETYGDLAAAIARAKSGAELAAMQGRATTSRGHPYRVSNYVGYLSGADLNTEFDGTTKYDRYREMRQRDPEIAGTLALLNWPYESARWSVEGDGTDEQREWMAKVLMSPPHPQALQWRQLLRHILKYREYGCYLFERIWTRDPETGRVYAYLSPRPPDTIEEWYLDGIRLAGVLQYFQDDNGEWKYAQIDGKNLVHFSWGGEANNVEGESILRACWPEYVSSKAARDLRNVMMERSTGVLKIVPKVDATGNPIPGVSGEDDNAITTARDFVGHEQNYIMESGAYGIEFMQTLSDGMSKCQDVMEYGGRTYKTRILADFMNQGRTEHGGFASAGVLQNPFWSALVGEGMWIVESLRRAWIAPIEQMNGFGDTGHTLKFSDLKAKTPEEELAPILQAVEKGVRMTPALERHLLEIAGAPEEVVEAVDDAPEQPTPPSPPDRGTRRSITTDETPERGDDDETEAGAVVGTGTAELASLPDYTVAPEGQMPRAAAGLLAFEPVGMERVVEFETVARRWDDAERKARVLIEEFRNRIIAHTSDVAAKQLKGNAPLSREQIATISNLDRRRRQLVNEYRRKLLSISDAEYERGLADVAMELRISREVLGQTPGPAPSTVTSATFNPTTGKAQVKKGQVGLVESALLEHAEKLGTAAASAATAQAILPTPNLEVIQRAMSSLSRGEVLGASRGVIATAYNSGRDGGAIKGKAATATYSTLLQDGKTCDNCAPLHLRVFTVGSPEYHEHKPPYKECFSAVFGGRGRNRCRDIYIYAYDTGEEAA